MATKSNTPAPRILIDYNKKNEDYQSKILEWRNSQANITKSILSLIEHAIDRFGNEDIMDHDISRKLWLEKLHFDGQEIDSLTSNTTANKNQSENEHASAIENKPEIKSADSQVDRTKGTPAKKADKDEIDIGAY